MRKEVPFLTELVLGAFFARFVCQERRISANLAKKKEWQSNCGMFFGFFIKKRIDFF